MPASETPWEPYTGNYDRIRDVMAQVLPGFEDYNVRVRESMGFRIADPPRERDSETPSGRAGFSHSPFPDVIPADSDVLVLQTMRSPDQLEHDDLLGQRSLPSAAVQHAGWLGSKIRAGDEGVDRSERFQHVD